MTDGEGGSARRGTRRAQDVIMTDVATAAGVSHMTVSRVLNGSARVSPGTRERVETALRQLGYRPNVAARALATGRSGQLAVVFFDTTLYGPASTLFAIEQAARREGYSVSILSLRQLDPTSMTDAVARLRAQAVDGTIIVAPYATAGPALAEVPEDLPAVVVGGAAGSGHVPAVALDQEAGARAATQHLLELGHRTVHHVAGPETWIDAGGRVRGWRAALAEAGATAPAPLTGDWSARSGYEAGRTLAADPTVTAIFVANDHMALGVLRALSEAGRPVPDDVSVVGFDDVPEAPYFPPALTTVRQDFDRVGRESVALLLRRVAGETGRDVIGVPTNLVVRASTGPHRP
jgi:DNA-binding LacI/PurR family transcriptional regulator